MRTTRTLPFVRRVATPFVFLSLTSAALAQQPISSFVRIGGSITQSQSPSVAIAPLAATDDVSFSVSLPFRDQAGLKDLLNRLYDPADPQFHKFLTPSQFAQRFAPTQSDYDAVAAWAIASGFRVTSRTPNRHLIGLAGSASAVQSALNVRMARFRTAEGRAFVSPLSDPAVPADIARKIIGFAGLSTAARWHTNAVPLTSRASANSIGTGPSGGLSPSDIRAAYGLTSVPENGTGQRLAVFELADYNASDIAHYGATFGITIPPLQNVDVDGGSPAGSASEVEPTLDIELLAALAPKASAIMVYMAPNSTSGILHAYNQIATDNSAKQISTSWGLDEGSAGRTFLTSENQIFQQFAAQGQTLYASSGDNGAYDNGSTLSVDDPASQPYVVATGGTALSTQSRGGAWKSESTWNNGSIASGAAGGGRSVIWPRPAFQAVSITGSQRCVPDVSLDADPNTGYAIYHAGSWAMYGGTSCAAPLWTSFNALVNQRRAANHDTTLGFANPLYYGIYATSSYATAFHDIADGSSNLFYTATAGYDLATGLGSMQGSALMSLLTSSSPIGGGPGGTVPSAPQNVQAVAGDRAVTVTWPAVSGATGYRVYRRNVTDGSFVLIGTTSTLSYTDTQVGDGAAYVYQVTAINTYGESGASNQVTATPVSVTGVPFPAGLNFLALPYTYSGQTLDALFGYTGATVAVYNAVTGEYALTPTPPANGLAPGRGYWIKLPRNTTVPLGGAVNSAQDFRIPLAAGWNQIGDPFLASVSVGALEIADGASTYAFTDAAQTQHLVASSLYWYNPVTKAYVAVTAANSIVPDYAYWIYASKAVTLVVPHL